MLLLGRRLPSSVCESSLSVLAFLVMQEYAFLVQTCEISSAVPVGESRSQVIAEKLVNMIEMLRSSLDSFDHGGWRALSHDVLETNGSLIVSFLICREERTRS